MNRRTMIATSGIGLTALVAPPMLSRWLSPEGYVFVAKGQSYDGDLVRTIRDGLIATGALAEWFAGKRVLLKPNLVEPRRDRPHMTTHPAVIVAAAEVFRRWGATVKVGEGPGHVRDTEMALIESGVGEALHDGGLEFADLNYEATKWQRNRGGRSRLRGFHLPQSVAEADVVVSLPKLKTHHWVGVTCSMKNFYGVLPGIRYGWPKNVLHHNGIPQTVADINATLPRTMTIVDGIDCMEGDGPILGSIKPMGLIVVGSHLASVDATVARIMGIDPHKIEYLALAPRKLGPLADDAIQQRGERWEAVASPFEMLHRPHLDRLRLQSLGPQVT